MMKRSGEVVREDELSDLLAVRVRNVGHRHKIPARFQAPTKANIFH
jgi:hypothetical protein